MKKLDPVGEVERVSALERYDIMDTPPDEAFDRITRLASKIFNAPIALISLVDKDRQWFKSRQGLDASETPREVAFCAHAIQSEEVMVVADARSDPRFAENPLVVGDPTIRFYAGAPLQSPDGHNLGTLCIIDRQPREMTTEQTALLSDLAAMVIDEMELRRLAATDSLTGALNRRHFTETAEREHRRAVRYAMPLSVFMMDIDLFKTINDTHGHAAGDSVLKRLIEVCRDILREQDVVGRLGGEEFAVLLPQTDEKGAKRVAERLRQAVSDTTVDADGKPVTFTVSIGVASLPPGGGDIPEALSRADAALYRAKADGRNRVAIADST